MNYYKRNSFRSTGVGVHAVGFFIVLVCLVLWVLVWFSHKEIVTGEVSAKWAEQSTSCGDNGCSTRTTYLFQLKDGRIFSTLWGTFEWDSLQIGQRVEFEAYGYSYRIFGFRGAVQSAINIKVIR